MVAGGFPQAETPGINEGSVSDPLFFLTEPDPTQKPEADPDPGIKFYFHEFFSRFA